MARVWFITGCSRGLGRCLAEQVLESGDSVAATARKPEQLAALVDKYGSKVLALPLDVTDAGQVAESVSKAHENFGRIDIVVNNAGYAETASVEDISLEGFRSQVDANFLGPVYVTKAVIPIMRRQGSGHIMQISSIGGRLGSPGLSGYQSAKWAIGGFSTVLAAEVAPFGVKVTVFEPGGIKTDWGTASMVTGEISEPYKQTVEKMSQLRQSLIPGQTPPDKMAKAIVYVSNVEEPPLRLLLGPDTIEYAKAVAANLAASDEKWRHVTSLADY